MKYAFLPLDGGTPKMPQIQFQLVNIKYLRSPPLFISYWQPALRTTDSEALSVAEQDTCQLYSFTRHALFSIWFFDWQSMKSESHFVLLP